MTNKLLLGSSCRCTKYTDMFQQTWCICKVSVLIHEAEFAYK